MKLKIFHSADCADKIGMKLNIFHIVNFSDKTGIKFKYFTLQNVQIETANVHTLQVMVIAIQTVPTMVGCLKIAKVVVEFVEIKRKVNL